MLRRVVLCRILVAVLAAAPLLSGSAQARGHAPVMVVAELFTSQGCSACAAADDLPAALADRPDVLALTFPVDYWDYLGWRDTYAQPAFSDRQRAYAKAMGVREVYTPQVVVDGVSQAGKPGPGLSLGDVANAMIASAAKARARRGGAAPTIAFSGRGQVRVGAGHPPRGGADVWLVRYQPAPADVAVTAGENSGKTVRYHNVVRELDRLGAWTGRAETFPEPQPSEGGLKRAVLIQDQSGGRIITASLAPAD
jgi:hypothetical protein